MTIQLENPVAAYTEKIAKPFEDAAPIVRQIASLYAASNKQLGANQKTLSDTFSGLGANAFTDMINKQITWVNGITGHINDLAGFYETCARDVRAAMSGVEQAIQPVMDIVQWVFDRLTPDIVVRQGEDAIHAVFNDMRAQLHREMSDASGFFGSLVHLHFGSALHDAVDGVKGLAHLGGDVIAMVGAVEPILCQWAANIYQAVNWLLNKVGSWILAAEDWLLGLSNIADDTVVFTDPNSTTEEKWLAGVDMGLNIGMDILLFIPGVDLGDLAAKGLLKVLEKFGLEEVGEQVLKQLAKFLEKVTLKELREKIVQKILSMFTDKLGTLFARIAAGDIDKQAAADILRALVGKKTIPAITITDPARQVIYSDLLKKFSNVDKNFIAHLVDANPGVTPLTEKQIENFLNKASQRGELEYITLLYTYVYKSDRPGLDQLLRDIANGAPKIYQGSLYQLEWIAAHNDEVKAVEVLDAQNRHGIDIIMNDGTYVDLKSYTSFPSVSKIEKQIGRYLRDFPDVKNHTLRFVYESGVNGINQAAIDKIKQQVENYGLSHGVKVELDLWPK